MSRGCSSFYSKLAHTAAPLPVAGSHAVQRAAKTRNGTSPLLTEAVKAQQCESHWYVLYSGPWHTVLNNHLLWWRGEGQGTRKGHEWEKKAPEVMMWFNELFCNIKCRICFRLRPVLHVQGEGFPVAPRWSSQWITRMQAKKKKRKMLILER